MNYFKKELHEYICGLCLEKQIPLEIHWRCFEDSSKFYRDGKEFVIACSGLYASDKEDIKSIIMTHIEDIWEDESIWQDFARSNYRVAIYVLGIEDMDGWYNVIIGSSISDGF